MRDATVALDGDRFNEDQARPAAGELAQMHQMPVVGEPFVRRILAHGGDDDAIAEFETAQA